MKLIEQSTDRYGQFETWFHDKDSGREFGRIVGGFAWPFEAKPGFGVVLAEDRVADKDLGCRRLRVLAETEFTDLLRLLRRCDDLRKEYLCRDWFGDTTNKTMMDLFYHVNRTSERDDFYLSPAPHIDDPRALYFYLNLIKEARMTGRRVLEFKRSSLISGYLSQVIAKDTTEPHAEYPAVSALGYALSYLRTTEAPTPYRKKQKPKGTWMSA